MISNITSFKIGETFFDTFRNIGFPLDYSSQPHKVGICVPPIYLAADWQQLATFIEIWRKLGATKFWVYATSVSKTVENILNIYVRRNIIELVEWPYLPKSDKVDPNSAIYRYLHETARYDCVRRAASIARFAAILDLDDYILPPEEYGLNISSYLEDLSRKYVNKGAFVFYHKRVGSTKRTIRKSVNVYSYTLDEHWKSLEFAKRFGGPAKYFLRPETVSMVMTHRVRKFYKRKIKSQSVGSEGGIYIHLKSFFEYKRDASGDKFDRFTGILESVSLAIKSVLQELDVKNLPTDTEILQKVRKCVGRWRNLKCKVPHLLCKNSLNLGNTSFWKIYDGEKTNSYFLTI